MSKNKSKLYENYRTNLNMVPNSIGNIKYFELLYIKPLEKMSKDIKILDLACGDGKIMKGLQKFGYKNLTGVDFSDEQVKKAAEDKLNIIHKDILEFLKEDTEKYSAVYLMDILEHLEVDETIQLFTFLKQKLMPKGVIIVRTPNGSAHFSNFIFSGDLTHKQLYSPSSLRQLLSICKFANVVFREDTCLPTNILNRLRLVIWKLYKMNINFIRRAGGQRKIEYLSDNFYSYIYNE